MESLQELEASSLRMGMMALQTEMKRLHLQVLNQGTELRANQSEIRMLKLELHQRKASQDKLTTAVFKLAEVTRQLKGNYSGMAGNISQLARMYQQRQSQPPQPPTQIIGGLALGTGQTAQLLTVLKTKFGQLNGVQASLQKEVGELKDIVKNLGNVNVDTPTTTTTAPQVEKNRTVSDNCGGEDEVEILSPPTPPIHVGVDISSPPSISPSSPKEGLQQINVQNLSLAPNPSISSLVRHPHSTKSATGKPLPAPRSLGRYCKRFPPGYFHARKRKGLRSDRHSHNQKPESFQPSPLPQRLMSPKKENELGGI